MYLVMPYASITLLTNPSMLQKMKYFWSAKIMLKALWASPSGNAWMPSSNNWKRCNNSVNWATHPIKLHPNSSGSSQILYRNHSSSECCNASRSLTLFGLTFQVKNYTSVHWILKMCALYSSLQNGTRTMISWPRGENTPTEQQLILDSSHTICNSFLLLPIARFLHNFWAIKDNNKCSCYQAQTSNTIIFFA